MPMNIQNPNGNNIVLTHENNESFRIANPKTEESDTLRFSPDWNPNANNQSNSSYSQGYMLTDR